MRIVLFVFLCAISWAQPTEVLTGKIVDGDGFPIPDGTVTVSGPGFERIAPTNEDGVYVMRSLPPGAYAVTVEAAGYLTYRATGIAVEAGRVRNHDAILSFAPVVDEIVVTNVSDLGSARPGYLPGAGLAPGSRIIFRGAFPVSQNTFAERPFPETLEGMKVEIAASGGVVRSARLVTVEPSRVEAILPDDVPLGQVIFNVTAGDQTSRPVRANIVDTAPTLLTWNGAGYGPAAVTDGEGRAFTFINPARKGSTFRLRMTNMGALPDLAPGSNALDSFAETRMLLGGGLADVGNMFLTVNSFDDGISELLGEFKDLQIFGCGVPIQVGFRRQADDPIRWTNIGNLPVSPNADGPCFDSLAFGPDEVPLLGDGGIRVLETVVTEGTFFIPTRRDLVYGRMQASLYDVDTYTPPPPIGACTYRWEPAGWVNPNAPVRLPLAGSATMTVPWGVFNLSPTSNNGPYSLVFSPPASYAAAGSYVFQAPQTFTIEGQVFTIRSSGEYRRSAGVVREAAIGLAIDRAVSQEAFLKDLHEAERIVPAGNLDSVYSDLNIVTDHGSLGRHLTRCLYDPTKERDFGKALASIRSLAPETANNTDVTLRWFPKQQIRVNSAVGSPVNRLNITLDSFMAHTNIGADRPQ